MSIISFLFKFLTSIRLEGFLIYFLSNTRNPLSTSHTKLYFTLFLIQPYCTTDVSVNTNIFSKKKKKKKKERKKEENHIK